MTHPDEKRTTAASGDTYGTLTTLVARATGQATAEELHLLVLEASGLSVHPLAASGTVSIGRADDCDVRLRDALASRHHATLHLRPLAIEDRGSANGTLVGSRLLESGATTPISPGQPISIGGSLLIVRRASDDRPRREKGDPSRPFGILNTPALSVVIRDPAMVELYRLIERAAAAPINVLILGETGAGKDVVAEAIHRMSPRREGPLIRINCAAISENLLESELFGHERGAFTGAVSAKPGLIEAANGGTVFLDEMGELSLALQAKLLRLIEAREVLRVGGLRPRPVDARFVAATNRDLEAEVARGSFRTDLYFRLNGFTVTVPPLRDRPSEIVPLCEMVLARTAQQMNRVRPHDLAPGAVALLESYPWPGNVRELRNVIERAALLCRSNVIEPGDLALKALSPLIGRSQVKASHTAIALDESARFDTAAPPALSSDQKSERERILQGLEQCNGNQTRAAKLLGIPRRTLVAKLATYRIPRPRKMGG